MNATILAILTIAGSYLIFSSVPSFPNAYTANGTEIKSSIDTVASSAHSSKSDDGSEWNLNAVKWLVDAQSPNGGWGAGSHAYQNVKDPHQVQTDPATTAFAAMALLKAGGTLKDNPYKTQILKALDRILQDIDSRPDNGRITNLQGTQPQVKLGVHIDASMALQFLTEISGQLNDDSLQKKTDDAAKVCIDLIQGSQDVHGGWADGGWAPVLQSAMANNALERAQGRYEVDEKAIERSRTYQAANISNGSVKSDDAAGIPLYAAASAQRATSVLAMEAISYLPGEMAKEYAKGNVKKEEVEKVLRSKGVDKDKAVSLATAYDVNVTSTQVLQAEEIWDGFGNNGGEEYLSYMLTSESLAQQGKNEWLKWRQSIEPKFKQSQNPNGSWSGHHCITSPVFCTSAIVQAWYAGDKG